MSQKNEPDEEANGRDDTNTAYTVPGRVSLFAKLILCLFIVVLADVVFYDTQVGWLSGVFFLLLGGMVVAVHGGLDDRFTSWFVTGWLGCMSVSLVVSVSPLSFLLGAVSLLALYSIRRFSREDHVFSFLRSMSWDTAQLFVSPVLDSFSLMKVSSRNSGEERGIFSRSAQWVVEWLIPAGLFVVFLVLFSLANPVFSSVFSPLRILFWGVVGVMAWGLLRLPRTRFRLASLPEQNSLMPDRFPRMSSGAVSLSLLVFNLLFLIQNGLDVMYLWGGRALPEGMTYAEYAHRGSYPLVVTALLAAVFVLISFRSGEKPERMRWARRLVYVWIVQNIVLLGSAAWRLWIYVDFYGLSRWRVATVLWMMLVAMGFVYILLRIVGGFTNRWLINVNAVTAIMLLTACTFVNVDRRIADYNVAHCKEVTGEGAHIDVQYLAWLGPDALPALKRLRPYVDNNRTQKRIAKIEQKYMKRLLRTLEDWRGVTYRRMRLLESIRSSTND